MAVKHHLLLYDGDCAFCNYAARSTLEKDKKGLFLFAPLKGTTAKKVLKEMPTKYKKEDTFVLVENYNTPKQHFYILGKGALRTLWLLGRPWSLLGWISFLPNVLYDWAYRFIGRHRKKILHEKQCPLTSSYYKKRFLP